jgi:L-threonylcarbamoyladenylate synthase
VTVILPTREVIPAAVSSTLAVRIPDHPGLRALLYRSGPLTGTSANRHTEPPSVSLDAAVDSLTSEPDLGLDAGPTDGGDPSTIVDLTGAEARIIRPGSVPWDEPYPEC